jgi:hypothetical protein
MPGDANQQVSIDGIYGRAHAETVVEAAIADYNEEFGGE